MQRQSRTATCPRCGSANVTKTGHHDGLRLDVYRCDDCRAPFTMETPKA